MECPRLRERLAHTMHIRVRYFAALRETVGREEETVELSEGIDVAAVRDILATRYPALATLLPRCVTAVNRAYVAANTVLQPDDELVFVPPLGGGTQWQR